MLDFDVVVVGAGPAGSSAALNAVQGGLRTVLVERRALPRHKPCSGLLVPEAMALVTKNFGSAPADIFAAPGTYKAMRMHFSSGRHFDVPIDGWMVWRSQFDRWLAKVSNADLFEQTSAESFSEDRHGVTLACRNANGEPFSLRSRVLVVADGGYSGLARQLDPVSHASLPWCITVQDNYECRIDLEDGYFHYFARHDLPMYPAAYLKDSHLIVDVSGKLGDELMPRQAAFKNFLSKQFGFVEKKRTRRMGCPIMHTSSAPRFQFGTDRVLVAGEASGLMNLFGEGISPALSSGLTAGTAAVQSVAQSRSAGAIYKQGVDHQRRMTLLQYSTWYQLFGTLQGIDWKVGLQALPWMDRMKLLKDLGGWASGRQREVREMKISPRGTRPPRAAAETPSLVLPEGANG